MDIKDFLKRVSVTVIAVPLLLYIIIYGSIPFEILVAGIIIISSEELINLLKKKNPHANWWMVRLIIITEILIGFHFSSYLGILFVLILLLLAMEIIRNVPEPGGNLSAALFPVLYPTMLLIPLVWLRHMEANGLLTDNFVLMIFISIWASDTFAYLGGVTFGKHRILPRVSPKKSWEGAFFGIAGGIFVWWLSASQGWILLPMSKALFLGALISIVAIFGDFFESLLKRDADIKDSSHLLPGHGGILDRFDGFIFVAPAVWALVSIW